MRPLQHHEAERLRDTLKTIAGFRNPAKADDPGQAAARLARETLDDLGLYLEEDANAPRQAVSPSGDQSE